jgi:hypothetical protein
MRPNFPMAWHLSSQRRQITRALLGKCFVIRPAFADESGIHQFADKIAPLHHGEPDSVQTFELALFNSV